MLIFFRILGERISIIACFISKKPKTFPSKSVSTSTAMVPLSYPIDFDAVFLQDISLET